MISSLYLLFNCLIWILYFLKCFCIVRSLTYIFVVHLTCKFCKLNLKFCLTLFRQYYTSVFVGNPPRPYFLDIDTGSDLTWIQCDAPCVSCTKVHISILVAFRSLVIAYVSTEPNLYMILMFMCPLRTCNFSVSADFLQMFSWFWRRIESYPHFLKQPYKGC